MRLTESKLRKIIRNILSEKKFSELPSYGKNAPVELLISKAIASTSAAPTVVIKKLAPSFNINFFQDSFNLFKLGLYLKLKSELDGIFAIKELNLIFLNRE